MDKSMKKHSLEEEDSITIDGQVDKAPAQGRACHSKRVSFTEGKTGTKETMEG